MFMWMEQWRWLARYRCGLTKIRDRKPHPNLLPEGVDTLLLNHLTPIPLLDIDQNTIFKVEGTGKLPASAFVDPHIHQNCLS